MNLEVQALGVLIIVLLEVIHISIYPQQNKNLF